MERRHVGLVSGWLMFLVVAFAVVPPAAGRTAIREEFVLEETVDVDCGTFVVREERTLHFKVTAFFEQPEEPTLVQLYIHGIVVRTNLATGKSSTEHPAVAIFIDFAAGTSTVVGGAFTVVIEGNGIVIQDTGRVVFGPEEILFEAGPQESLHDPGLTCSHLA